MGNDKPNIFSFIGVSNMVEASLEHEASKAKPMRLFLRKRLSRDTDPAFHKAVTHAHTHTHLFVMGPCSDPWHLIIVSSLNHR